jgi:hypothetical protein
MRDRNMLAGLPFDARLRVLDLVEHYHATADALEECDRLLCTLNIERYWGDYTIQMPSKHSICRAQSRAPSGPQNILKSPCLRAIQSKGY